MEKASLQEWIEFKDKINHTVKTKKLRPSNHKMFHAILGHGGSKLVRLAKILLEVPTTATIEFYEAEDGGPDTYDKMICKLDEYFKAKKTTTMYRLAIYDMAQKERESTAAFVDRVLLAGVNAGLEPAEYNRVIIDRVALTAREPRIRAEAVTEGITMVQLLEFANKVEAQKLAKEIARKSEGDNALPEDDENEEDGKVALVRRSRFCNKCGGSEHENAQCPAINRRCFNCGDFGHMARQCVKKKRFDTSQSNGGGFGRRNDFGRRNEYGRRRDYNKQNESNRYRGYAGKKVNKY